MLVRVVLVIVALVNVVHMSVVLVVIAFVNVVDVTRLVAMVFMLVALVNVVLVSVVLVSVALVNVVWHLYLHVAPKLCCYYACTILAEIMGNSKLMGYFWRIIVVLGIILGKTQILSVNTMMAGDMSAIFGANVLATTRPAME